jgi:hypothetical protein
MRAAVPVFSPTDTVSMMAAGTPPDKARGLERISN